MHRSIAIEDPESSVQIIDQRYLPFKLVVEELTTLNQVIVAIKEMHVRGAPLIGVTAAYGVYLALKQAPETTDWTAFLEDVAEQLQATRPTAVNLSWALSRMKQALAQGKTREDKLRIAFEEASHIADEDVKVCEAIGEHGLSLIEKIAKKKGGKPVNVLTHCNAGWLACVEWGTATSPLYKAHHAGIPLHVWVDETRPRNQGSKLTAWELSQRGIAHTVIVDNAGGHLMQQGQVDLVLVGSDRTARNGDVANKIGTYLKALAAKANEVPFYVCLPSSTLDWNLSSGKQIPIEERSQKEVTHVEGLLGDELQEVQMTPQGSAASNYGFDVTPAEYVTGLITERGICPASEDGLRKLYPEKINA